MVLDFKSTADIKTSDKIIEQVVGQEDAVNVIKKAAAHRRHVLLIGEPGTGKSMLGLALAELLPKEKLVDVLSFQNPNDENTPLIRTVPAGQGRDYVARARIDNSSSAKTQTIIILVIVIVLSFIPYYMYLKKIFPFDQPVIYAASMITSFIVVLGLIIMINLNKKMGGMQKASLSIPKVIVDNFDKKHAPFFDATGAHAGALLGDVLHDPFHSGGLGTPANQRVVAGMIHKAHLGVLFIDEIATLHPRTQQELLSALQERKFPITGQSERSA